MELNPALIIISDFIFISYYIQHTSEQDHEQISGEKRLVNVRIVRGLINMC